MQRVYIIYFVFCDNFMLYFVRTLRELEKVISGEILLKRGELGQEGISCCNSRRGDRVDGDGVRKDSLEYKTGCTLF